ncbi:MAG: T9SS type A sorting domain-containing protein [Flavobacteriales bacterium]|nr:T9SS type A sorting domain-containing protein [Flavobacteriales bacterium]
MKANYTVKRRYGLIKLDAGFKQFNRIKYTLGILAVMVLTLIFPHFTIAQSTFATIVDGSAEDTRINAVQEISAGGYILAGERDVSGTPSFCAYLAKTDNDGDLAWATVVDGSSEDTRIKAVLSTSDGGYILAGERDVSATPSFCAYIAKVDGNGTLVWASIIDGSAENTKINSIQATSDGGYILGGERDVAGTPSFCAYLAKVDANGILIWSAVVDGSSEDTRISAVRVTSDGGYILAGERDVSGTPSFCAYLAKTDANGTLTWSSIIDGSAEDTRINSVQLTSDGGYILGGERNVSGTPSFCAYLAKTDASGTLSWASVVDGSAEDTRINSIQTTSGGGYILAGERDVSGTPSFCAYIAKTDANGTLAWASVVDGSSEDTRINSAQVTSDGGYILAGERNVSGTPSFCAYLAKTDDAGIILGFDNSDLSQSTFQTTSFPNPFNDRTEISFEIKRSGPVALNIYNGIGQQVATLVNESLSAGNYKVAFEGHDLPTGIYIYRLEAGGLNNMGKLTLVK